jgi:GH18 family chitinase
VVFLRNCAVLNTNAIFLFFALGGWADSTAPGKYNIMRSAIINNRETFATNLAKFADEEGIDGIDIDWEYPGVSVWLVKAR